MKLNLEEIHSCTLEVLGKLIEICELLNINYFAMYGTLIGAVRHKGFIPWDDDLDIAMLRPDFDKFVKYCAEHREELFPFLLKDVAEDPMYPFMIPRFCDMRYKMVYHEMPELKMGIFIDIYPFDGIGNADEAVINHLTKKKQLYTTGLTYSVSKNFPGSRKSIFHKAIRYFLYRFSKMKGREYYVNKLQKLCQTFSLDESAYIGCLAWNRLINPFRKEYFQNYETLPFERYKIKVPKNYDTVLRILYGDYMKLPPESERVPYHNYSVYKIEDNGV